MPRYKKRADGRYQTNVRIGTQPNGKPKYKTIYARSQTELERKVREFKGNLDKGIIITDNNITLGEWALKWFSAYKGATEINTKAMYSNAVNKYITKSSFATYKIGQIKPSDMMQYINSLKEKGLTRTVEIVVLTLKQIFDAAIDNNLIYISPLAKIKTPHFKSAPKECITEIERNAIINAPISDKQRAYLFLALFAGLRREEILALTKRDINFAKNVISIRNVLVFDGNDGIIKNYPKSDCGVRDIPMPSILKKHLASYLGSLTGIYLFEKQNGGVFTKSAFRKMFDGARNLINEYCGGNKNIKAVDFTSHILRHTFATNLFKAGIDVKTAQNLLGHSSVSMTIKIYNHFIEANETVIEKLEKVSCFAD